MLSRLRERVPSTLFILVCHCSLYRRPLISTTIYLSLDEYVEIDFVVIVSKINGNNFRSQAWSENRVLMSVEQNAGWLAGIST